MNFENALKKELFENTLKRITQKIKTLDSPTEEEKIKIAANVLSISSHNTNLTKTTLKEKILSYINELYNSRINCGGYALELDTCLFGTYYKGQNADEHLDRNVSNILELFPFVRLLGNTELQEDEYLVEYRADENGSHHFIKIDSSGNISDKNETNPPRDLNSHFNNENMVWGNLANAPHAIFAVKSEHDFHTTGTYFLSDGLNFEETVLKAIQDKSNKFEYHSKKYTICTNSNYNEIVCENGESVAQIITDDSGSIVNKLENKKDFISNTNSSTYDNYLKHMNKNQLSNKSNNNRLISNYDDFKIEL